MGAVFVLASCATTPEVTSDFDRSANFATYNSFAVMQRELPGIPGARWGDSHGGRHQAGAAPQRLYAGRGSRERRLQG